MFQFDFWEAPRLSGRWNWDVLRKEVMEFGARNSLLVAPMPTASTSQILGNNECFEPYTSNVYSRGVLSGEFAIVNKHLLNELVRLDLWNDEMKNRIMAANGSVQQIDEIPEEIREVFKTAWEIKQKSILDMAADRGAFICQSQSMNVFMAEPTFSKLSSMHFYAWKKGLKTGMYYLRTKPAVNAIQFTVDTQAAQKSNA
jgi:ribonucleoside-diphosphate reductase alpha chain